MFDHDGNLWVGTKAKGLFRIHGNAVEHYDHLSGLLAWIVWACIHVMNLVTFQNRFLVFFQWAIQELTFTRGARLITGTASTDFSSNKEVALHRGALKMEPETAAAPR